MYFIVHRKHKVDMYNMIGYCPDYILRRNIDYCFKNYVDDSDDQLSQMVDRLVDIVSIHIMNLGAVMRSRFGLVLNSGSEANEVALKAYKLESPAKKIVVASTLCHSSIEYACKVLGLELVKLPVNLTTLRVDESVSLAFLEKNADNILLINFTYGTTKFGTSADIEFSNELVGLIRKNGLGVHVDAAYGGTIISMIESSPAAWKKYEFVRSISVDMHKFIGPLGCSLLLFPDGNLQKSISNEVNYFKGRGTQLGTTRSAYPLACVLDMIEDLKMKKIKQLALKCNSVATTVSNKLKQSGYQTFSGIHSGVVSFRVNNLHEQNHYIDNLYRSGFKVSPITLQNGSEEIYGFRIVVTPKKEMSGKNIKSFIGAMKSIRQDFKS